ncbi:hypothetical protein CHS0354_022523 [Potamilus streckersoni]|uniref:Uncharacterized protein n=1 Tax=Potamilus streckersoni TaxID=2493646 RepID=A0AAE0S6W6_9BIVA|nr:hypothetical protein CHS0354_022523 [Potamilus streckersoni]
MRQVIESRALKRYILTYACQQCQVFVFSLFKGRKEKQPLHNLNVHEAMTYIQRDLPWTRVTKDTPTYSAYTAGQD